VADAAQVDQTFEVRGVGCVLSGTVVSGSVMLGQQLWLGPDDSGAFKSVTVTCIQREQVTRRHLTSYPMPQDEGLITLVQALFGVLFGLLLWLLC
jgi:hypothetical protein